MQRVLPLVATLAMLVAFTEPLAAHGGQYRGPEDVVPPNPGGGRGAPVPGAPTTGGPGAPGAPVPAGPSAPSSPGTGMPGTPGSGVPGSPTTGGSTLVGDLTSWVFWWEFNKDPFLQLRAAIHDAGVETVADEIFTGNGSTVRTKDTLAPSRAQIQNSVLPELRRALENSTSRDITSSCLVALAKIGQDHPEFDILPILESYLADGDQEIRETAAVALGISQMPAAVPTLRALALDAQEARELTGRRSVDHRTRSFATYGLGLAVHANSDHENKRIALDAFRTILDDDSIVDRNVRVAALNAIGLLRPTAADPAGSTILDDALALLDAYFARDFGVSERLIQAHVPTAVAKLLADVAPTDPRHDSYRARYAALLRGDVGNEIDQSLVLALGVLGSPAPEDDRESTDARVRAALRERYARGHDQQSRLFALLALGQIGGSANRTFLLRELRSGTRSIERPWAALALGVLCHEALEANGSVDGLVGEQLLEQAREIQDPVALSAVCVALGLARYTPAADHLRAELAREWNKEPLGGYLCIGLALIGDSASVPAIQDTVRRALRRPDLLQQAAVALGKLGDKSVGDLLLGMLREGDTNLAKLSAIASALGRIGDRRSIEPLIALLRDDSLTPLSRAFAAVALGSVGDKEALPWNSKISCGSNYRAAVETLTNQQTGILDIL
jgi:HEAT repeat protein